MKKKGGRHAAGRGKAPPRVRLSAAERAKRAKAVKEWGDVRALSLSVYRNKRGAFDSDASIKSAITEAKKAFPGAKVVLGKKTKGKRWRASIVFQYPISREVMAKRLGSVKWGKIDKKNGRLHLLAEMRNRSVEPLSAAHANAKEAATEAQDQLLTNYFQYPRDDDDEEMSDQSIKRAVAKISRRRHGKRHSSKSRSRKKR